MQTTQEDAASARRERDDLAGQCARMQALLEVGRPFFFQIPFPAQPSQVAEHLLPEPGPRGGGTHVSSFVIPPASGTRLLRGRAPSPAGIARAGWPGFAGCEVACASASALLPGGSSGGAVREQCGSSARGCRPCWRRGRLFSPSISFERTDSKPGVRASTFLELRRGGPGGAGRVVARGTCPLYDPRTSDTHLFEACASPASRARVLIEQYM